MSYECDIICKLVKITDDDTGMYVCGEIDGGFYDIKLKEYLNKYGEKGKTDLLNKLAYLQWQVIDCFKNNCINCINGISQNNET